MGRSAVSTTHDSAEGAIARISAVEALPRSNPWASLNPGLPEQTSPQELPNCVPENPQSPATNNRFIVTTDIPENISISDSELDILEIHFGEFIRTMLAGNDDVDPRTQ